MLCSTAAFFAGHYFALLRWQAGAALVLLGAVAYAGKVQRQGWLKAALLLSAAAITLDLSLHRFPGFVNPAVVTDLPKPKVDWSPCTRIIATLTSP